VNSIGAYLKRKLDRFWFHLITIDMRFSRIEPHALRPGDEERLLQMLIDMSASLARAARF
jgi:hypothetical protein